MNIARIVTVGTVGGAAALAGVLGYHYAGAEVAETPAQPTTVVSTPTTVVPTTTPTTGLKAAPKSAKSQGMSSGS